jgi:ATP-binding cassette subfamily B protein
MAAVQPIQYTANHLRHAWRAVRLVWNGGPSWFCLNLVVTVLQGLLPLAGLYLMKLIVDAITAGIGPEGEGLGRAILLVAAAGGVALLNVALGAFAQFVGEAQGLAVTDQVYDVLHEKSLAVDLQYYESAQYYDALHIAQQEAPYRPVGIVSGLTRLCRSSVALAGVTILLFSFHPAVAVILFLAVIPSVYVRFWCARRLYDWQCGKAPSERLARYMSWLLTGDEHAKEVRLFGLGPTFCERFRGLRRDLRTERLNLTRRRCTRELVAQTVSTAAIFVCFGIVAWQAVRGTVPIGSLVMYFMAFQRGQGYLRGVMESLASIYENNLFIAHFYAFLDLETKVRERPDPRPVPRPIREGIVFEDVGFRYEPGTHPVLSQVSFSIRPGEHVALVGCNGAGKTTLVKLLCRLYDPTAGRILVDGIDLRDVSIADWRAQIGVILQDYAQYQLTARDNIRFGHVELDPHAARIREAAVEADADPFLRDLPHSYDTILGRWFEGGEELSIGQWQKVALARAFVRDVPIAVLDEPTSALDPRAESEVFERFLRQARDRTILIVSHRMSTVRMVDRIVLLDGGRVTETGSHDELMRLDGAYASLFRAQAEHYR